MRLKAPTFMCLSGLFLLCLSRSGSAFDDKAHDTLSRQVVKPQNSTIDSFLKNVLGGKNLEYTLLTSGEAWYCPSIGQTTPCTYQLQFNEFPVGIEQPIGGEQVTDLIAQGSLNEDKPPTRVRYHFHDPTLAWDKSGWAPPPLFIQLAQSSIRWGQNTNQIEGGNHSWKDARDSYFNALTGATRVEREGAWTQTLRTLGHQIHLIQDAAAPSHTRNDTHLFKFGIGQHDSFHAWADSSKGQSVIADPNLNSRPFNQSILSLSANPLAPIPIAHIIDSTDNIDASPSPGTDRGLAEYSNTYFFSDDTIFQDYPFPDGNSVHVAGPEFLPEIDFFRRYLYFNNPTTDTNHRLAVASRLVPFVSTPIKNQQWELDNKVLSDYGRQLFPRAIGYSAGLINYFFRGKMAMNPGCDNPLVDGCHPNGRAPCLCDGNVITLNTDGIKNISDVGEETGQGTVWAVWPTWAIPRGVDTQGNDLPPVPGTEVIFRVSDPLPINLTRDFSPELTFTFSNDPPPVYPNNAGAYLCLYGGSVPCDVHLIYRGPLGGETDAIIVLRTPIDVD